MRPWQLAVLILVATVPGVALAQELLPLEQALVSAGAGLRQATVQVRVGGVHGGPAVMASGFVWDEEGRVVTSASRLQEVAGGGTVQAAIEVEDAAGRRYRARLLGQDALTDLAVLEVRGQPGVPLAPGQASELEPGRLILAMGNPFGLEGSLIVGVVSGLDRTLVDGDRLFAGVVQTTATWNPGDTGGPVVDTSGRLVGMVFSTYGRSPAALAEELERELDWVTRSREFVTELRRRSAGWWPLAEEDDPDPDGPEEDPGEAVHAFFDRMEQLLDGVRRYGASFLGKDLDFLGAQGISFILPVEQVGWVVESILEHGEVPRGWLGITGVPDPDGPGVRVEKLQEGGPAERAGLRGGDLILAWGDRSLTGVQDLQRVLAMMHPGQTGTLLVKREGEELQMPVELGRRPDDDGRPEHR